MADQSSNDDQIINTRFIQSIINNDQTTFDELITLQNCINTPLKDYDDKSVLHLASDPHIIQLLIDHNADINAIDASGATPLFYCKNLSSLETLLDNGADINATDKNGSTLLHIYAGQSYGITQYLLQDLMDPHAVDNIGQTPIHHAKDAKMVQLLTQFGAKVNALDDNRRTALHKVKACDVTQALLDAKANANITDTTGMTALSYALMNKLYDIATILVSNGASVDGISRVLGRPLQDIITESENDELFAVVFGHYRE